MNNDNSGMTTKVLIELPLRGLGIRNLTSLIYFYT
nr:MAG TPA: hypothetical protein [Caudoviricetes sp.]